MAYAHAGDVADRLGRELDISEARIVNARLDDVELMIKARISDLDDRVTAGDPSEDVVIMVEADVVLRLLRNPEGIVGETDGNYSYQLNWANVTGRLTITDEDWALLGIRQSVFTIAPRLWNQADVDAGDAPPPQAPAWWWPQ
jgi:hypothetical protein